MCLQKANIGHQDENNDFRWEMLLKLPELVR